MQAYHLKGQGHSGRAVKVEALPAHDVEDNLFAAASLAGPQATGLQVKKIEWRNGVKAFVKFYTDANCEDPTAADVKWKKASVQAFDEDGLAHYFTAKDVAVLESLYCNYHEVTPAEIAAIVGKPLTVSAD